MNSTFCTALSDWQAVKIIKIKNKYFVYFIENE